MIVPLSSVSLSAAALGIANHLWQSTTFAVVAGFIILLLQKHGARWRYLVWMAASVKFLLPFSLLMFIGSHLALPADPSKPATRAYVALDRMSQPFVGDHAFIMPTGYEQPRAEHRQSSTQLFLEFAAAVWLCGFMGITGYWIVQWRRLRKVVNAATPLLGGREYALFRKVQQSMGVCGKIELLASEEWTEPGIVGIFHHVLFWPKGVSDHLDDAHLEAIFAHELCHVDRRDNFTALLHMVVESVFWFHPLVWWMGGQMVNEREQACDEQVLLAGKDPEIYAESILRVCKFCLSSPLACVAGVSGAYLKKRVMLIMKADVVSKLGSMGKGLLCATMAIVITLPLFLGSAAVAYAAKKASSTHPVQPRPQDAGSVQKLKQMPKDADPSFEVASIKLSPPNDPNQGFHERGQRLQVENETVNDLIKFAYAIHEKQITEAPPWFATDRYDIEGLPNVEGTVNLKQYRGMIRKLLDDRFHIKFRRETRELPVFAIRQAKDGARIDKSTHSPDEIPDQSGMNTTMRFTNNSMDDFALGMQFMVQERPIVNQTGLDGRYDFTLRWTPERLQTTDLNAPPGMFTAIQEQLGLKLEATKAPVDVLVIEHVERPSEN